MTANLSNLMLNVVDRLVQDFIWGDINTRSLTKSDALDVARQLAPERHNNTNVPPACTLTKPQTGESDHAEMTEGRPASPGSMV